MIKYNSMDINCRNPIGAIEENTSVSITIKVLRRNAFNVQLVYNKDGEMPKYKLMDWIGFSLGYDIYTAEMVPDMGLYWYRFNINGHEVLKDHSGAMWQLTVYKKGFKTPDWLKGGLIYHIFVDRFYRFGNTPIRKDVIFREDWGGTPMYKPDEKGIVKNIDFFGGNLKGICKKLDYIKSLNVNAIYLSPIFEANSNHKYDTGDYNKIDSMFGTEQDFENLVNQAKKRGIRIILDGVFAHTGDDSIYFNKHGRYDSVGAYQSKNSKYFSWYNFNKWNEDYDCWWGIKILPSINNNSKEFQSFIANDVIKGWMKKGANSWRLDVADELSDEMIETIRKAAKEENPESIIIGEVWDDASNKVSYGIRRNYLLGSQLDSVMNYPLKDAIIQFVKDGNAQILKDVMQSQVENYPPQVLHCLMNILGTHDTMRILTVLGTDKRPDKKEDMETALLDKDEYFRGINRLKAASLLQMFLPGVPCIYYGDEAGMQGYIDPFNRRAYTWGNENRELVAWYRKISALRQGEKLLKNGLYRSLCAKEGIFIFERYNDKEKIIIGVNFSKNPVHLKREKLDLLSNKTTDKIFNYIIYKETS